MKIVTVIPLKKGLTLTDLTYFTSRDVPLGSMVTVPLRSKQILGLAISVEDVADAKSNIKDMDFNLRKVIDIKDQSIFLKEYLESIIEASKYFVSSKNNAVTSLLPVLFREKYDQLAGYLPKKNKIKSPVAPVREIKKNIRAEKLILQVPLEERLATYKTIIRGAFADKKSVYIVVPTERDTEIFHQALSRGIEQFSFMLHGGISPKKILSNFEKIVSNEHSVLIVGTPPFLSIPRKDIKIIILEHESSNAYKMIARPYFDLRVFVELFAAKMGARYILSDNILRFETIARREIDGLIPLQPMSFRIDFPGEIKIQKRERAERGERKEFKILTDECIEEIKRAIAEKKNVLIFSLRKGLATQTVCRDCGETLSCEKCFAPVVLYLSKDGKKRIFSCNKCKREIESDIKCKNCGSWNLMPLGIGDDTVYEEIKKIFPKVPAWKLDKESAKTSKGAEKIVKEFENTEGSILIATEMAFSYLTKKVDLSIIASFDSLWSIPNYKMSEKIVQIINSMVLNTEKKFIIQTKNDKDGALMAMRNSNLLSFVREELRDRQKLGYPPYKRFIKIAHIGDKERSARARAALSEYFADYAPEIFSGYMPKLAGKYSTNALIKVDPATWSLPEISHDSSIDENLSNKLQSLTLGYQITIDPEDLL